MYSIIFVIVFYKRLYFYLRYVMCLEIIRNTINVLIDMVLKHIPLHCFFKLITIQILILNVFKMYLRYDEQRTSYEFYYVFLNDLRLCVKNTCILIYIITTVY